VGSEDDYEFGPETAAIRKWLEKRASYAGASAESGRHRRSEPTAPPRESLPSGTTAARAVLSALDPAPTAAAPAEQPAAPTAPVAPAPRKIPTYQPDPSTWAELEPPPAGTSLNRVFRPRSGVRTVVSGVLLLAVAATAAAGWYAYQEQTATTIGMAAILALLTLVVWAVRAGAAPVELAVLNGQLEMIHGGRFEVIDLASPFTPVLVEGEPGRRGWRVLIERPEQPLLVIDKTVVDPHEFSEVLLRLRPDLRKSAPRPA
jgi:hypothetical protein